MKQKVLRPTTIIPAELYVERAADRQLDQIVADMGRPGYVLVARQMGKTNLLLNMKQRHEGIGEIVVYIDLTTRFESARSLFRYLVDSITASALNEDDASQFQKRLDEQRASSTLQPNLEYDRHIRELLRKVAPKKIVVILDEIDSLTNVAYSDTIFAQIRSMYFSRANHSEYSRLTYVLSGVAEPTDLIKDKNISPFNIGEKIYLEDFSVAEFKLFVERAKLALPAPVSNEVYSWAGGNPRMTWDICAELEDRLIDGESLNVDSVGKAIKKLYLDRYDRPPVDHIRSLAENDPEIRGAIASIKWGKAETLDEREKSRLYLAGITGVVSGSAPVIKNKILELALSDEWLAQISRRQKGLLDAASDEFSAHRYGEAVRLIDEYAKGDGTPRALPWSSLMQLGMSKYFLANYVGAADDLKKAMSLPEGEADNTVTCKYYFASSLLMSGKPSESIPILREALAAESTIRPVITLALGSALLAESAVSNFAEIESLNKELLENSVSGDEPESSANVELKASANFNLAQVYALNDNLDVAEKYIDLAVTAAPNESKPAILLRKASFHESVDQLPIVLSASEMVMDCDLKFKSGHRSALQFSREVLASLLSACLRLDCHEMFGRLLSHAVSNLYPVPIGKFDLLVELFEIGAPGQNQNELLNLLETAVAQFADDNVEQVAVEAAYRKLALFSPDGKRDARIKEYLGRLPHRLSTGAPVAEEDALILINVAQTQMAKHALTESLETNKLVRAVLANLAQPSPLFSCLALNQQLVLLRNQKRNEEARATAREFLTEFDANVEKIPVELREIFTAPRRAALEFLEPPVVYQNFTELDPYRHIGRNQRVVVRDVKLGGTLEKKYKYLESGLRSGALELVEVKSKGGTN